MTDLMHQLGEKLCRIEEQNEHLREERNQARRIAEKQRAFKHDYMRGLGMSPSLTLDRFPWEG